MDSSEESNQSAILDWSRHWRLLRASLPILGIVFVVFLPLGVLLARFVGMPYTATMVVTAARYTNDTKPSTPTGLGSLLTSGSGELSDFSLYLKIFGSTLVADRVFKDHPDLVRRIYAGEWQDGHWAPPRTLKQKIKTIVYRLVGATPWSPPTPLRLAQYLGSVTINQDRRDPIATISVSAGKRDIALAILTVLHDEAENVLKDEATTRSKIKSDFLSRMASDSHVVDVTQSVGLAQVHNEISAAISKAPVPFAAEYISPPDAPVLPDQTTRVYTPLITSFLAVIFAYLFLFLRSLNPAFLRVDKGSLHLAGRKPGNAKRYPSHAAGE